MPGVYVRYAAFLTAFFKSAVYRVHRRNKRKKNIITVVLAVMLVICLIPATALAADTVTANGGDRGQGIGGGARGDGGTVTISGGNVFATGDYFDIGYGFGSSGGGTLGISGTAAVFLRKDNCITPTAPAHTHYDITGAAGGSVYGVPSSWTGDFGAYLRLYTLSYNANNGSGTVPESVTQQIGTTASVYNGRGLSKTNNTFSGWNMAADGSGTAYAAGSTFSFPENTTLYAQWAVSKPPVSKVTALTLYTGVKKTLTPLVTGGTWTWDSSFLNVTQNSDGSVLIKGLREGNTTVHYTYGYGDENYAVTILAETLPQTGQDFTWMYGLIVLAGCALIGAVALGVNKMRKKRV